MVTNKGKFAKAIEVLEGLIALVLTITIIAAATFPVFIAWLGWRVFVAPSLPDDESGGDPYEDL